MRARGRPRILVVGQQGLLRDALCVLLTSHEFDLVAAVPSLEDAIQGGRLEHANIVLLDLPLTTLVRPGLIASSLKMARPDVRVLALTSDEDADLAESVIQAGADGCVAKSDSSSALLCALRKVATDRPLAAVPEDARAERPRAPVSSAAHAGRMELSEREQQVMRLIAGGRRTREIAAILSLSHKTIEKHRTSLMRKLGLRNASAVAAYAIANGIVTE
jgi:DNA-binding NarL/FixJ family response regulator